jgi:hypothetical protein
MAIMTLTEAKKYVQDELIQGVIEDIIDVNPIFSVLPFTGYDGHGIIGNREKTLADVDVYNVNATITARNVSEVDPVTFTAIKIIGDADLDKLIQIQSKSGGVDLMANEIASKAKSIARRFQSGMILDNGTAPNMNSMHSMIDATQVFGHATGEALSFQLLDELLDKVTSKDSKVDFIMMSPRTFRSYKTLLRALGGTPAEWVVELPDGRTTIGYEDIPIFKNSFIPTTETAQAAAVTGGSLTSVWAGNWDDGTLKTGLTAIHPSAAPAGIQVEVIGTNTDKDSETFRVKQYTNMALMNRRALARLTSINN